MTDSWWRARTLAERAGDLPGDAVASGDGLERWRAEFPDDEVFAARLALAGLDAEGLARVLGAADRPPADPAAPAWWAWIAEALRSRSPAPETDLDLVRGAIGLVAPLGAAARREIVARLGAAAPPGAPFRPDDAARQLTRPLVVELAALASPAVVLELQAARAAGALTGDTPQERASRFLRELLSAGASRRFYADNPALSRAIHDRAQLAIAAGVELLARLAADWPALRGERVDLEAGRLTAIEPLGDAHDGGRRVARLTFASGAALVYKPRSSAADRAWSGLLDWLTRAGFGLAFRTARTAGDHDDYSWHEWLDASPCRGADEVHRYYVRLGGQLALLHALQAIDTHQDNVLACSEHPVMVDLECLLHPRLGGEAAATVDPLIAATSAQCVLRVGLLPRADVAFDIDVSGIGRDAAAAASVEEMVVLDAGSDEVRVGRQPQPVPVGLNVPRIGDEPVRPHDHVEALAAGFESAHRLLRTSRDALLAPGGALAPFAELPVRLILRPTRSYGALLWRQASRPAASADGLAREEALNALWRGSRRRPDLLVAAAAEHHDLSCGDIPKITAMPGDDAGRHHALGTLDGLLGPHRTPLPDCVRRLDEADAGRQLAFLRAAVGAATGDAGEPGHRLAERTRAPQAGEVEGAARAVARRLELLALRDGPAAGWLTAVPAPGHAGRVLRPLRAGLGEGQAGVSVFLATFAHAAGDDRAHALAAAATFHLCALLDETDGSRTPRDGGVLFALARLATLLEDTELLERALAIVSARGSQSHPAEADAAGLAARAIGVAALGAAVRDDRVITAAHDCAARLMAAAVPASAGMVGGRAGRALGLMRLAELLRDDGLHRAAAELLRPAGAPADASWATGSAGDAVALACALRAARCPREPWMRTALRGCAGAAVEGGLGRNHSLATGDVGTLLALAEAADALGDPLLRARASGWTSAVLASVCELGARCAGPGAVEVPGVLAGLAGMGLGWLRLRALEREPPAAG